MKHRIFIINEIRNYRYLIGIEDGEWKAIINALGGAHVSDLSDETIAALWNMLRYRLPRPSAGDGAAAEVLG